MIDTDTKDFASVFVLEDSAEFPILAINQYSNLLGKSEIQRHNKIKNPKRRCQFVISRLLLLEAIYRQLGVRVTTGSCLSGQPFIVGQPIFCSISYSNYSIAVGYSTYGAIGVDIEKHQKRKIDRLVRSCFHTDEVDYFDTLSESLQVQWFYPQWTHKEATLKADGKGINLGVLGTKIDENALNKIISVYAGHNYSLACVHHSDQPVQLNQIIIRNEPPWIDFSLRYWQNKNI